MTNKSGRCDGTCDTCDCPAQSGSQPPKTRDVPNEKEVGGAAPPVVLPLPNDIVINCPKCWKLILGKADAAKWNCHGCGHDWEPEAATILDAQRRIPDNLRDRYAPVLQGEREAKMPILPDSLLKLIGDYGMARTDGLNELEVHHRWQLLIDGIKDYARASSAAQIQATEETDAFDSKHPISFHLAEPSTTATDTRLVSGYLLNFLDGSGAINGVWFGDQHPAFAGRFWWRKVLRADIEALNGPDAGLKGGGK